MKDILYKNIRLLTYSFLDGATLYHKIALLNKETRASLPGAGLLDQLKELKLSKKTLLFMPVVNEAQLEYALQIVDNINFIAHYEQRYQDQFQKICQIIKQKNASSNKKVSVSLLTTEQNSSKLMMSLINSLNLPILAREDLILESTEYYSDSLPDNVQQIKKINVINADNIIFWRDVEFYNCEFLTLIESNLNQFGFMNLRQIRELNLQFIDKNKKCLKRFFDQIIHNNYFLEQGLTISKGLINLIPSKQFRKLKLKIKNDGTLKLNEIGSMMQRSLEVHESLKILLVSIETDSFQLPQFTSPNQDQISIQLEPNQTFLFDSFVITIVSEEYNPKNQWSGFYSQYYFENIYKPRLYQIQFGKQNSNIQLVIQTSKILVFDDDKQETELLQINQTKIFHLNPVVSYKSKMFEQPNSKLKMLQDPFFQLEKTQQFALLRRELFETIELEDQLWSYSHDQILSKHKPGERQQYDCSSVRYRNEGWVDCRSGQTEQSEQYVQGWFSGTVFSSSICEPCLQIERFLGNTLARKFPAQNFIYSDNEHHFYLKKVSTIGRQFKNEQTTFQNILNNTHQYYNSYCDKSYSLQERDQDEQNKLKFDDIRTEKYFSRCSIQMMRYNDLQFKRDNYIPQSFEYIAMQEYQTSWKQYPILHKLAQCRNIYQIELDVQMNGLYDPKKSKVKQEIHNYSIKPEELEPKPAQQFDPAPTNNGSLFLNQMFGPQKPQQNTVGQFQNQGGSVLFSQPQNLTNQTFGQLGLFEQKAQIQPISAYNNPLTFSPKPTVQSLFGNQLVSQSASNSLFGAKTTFELQSGNVKAKADEVFPTLNLSGSLFGVPIQQLSQQLPSDQEQKQLGEATQKSLWLEPVNERFSVKSNTYFLTAESAQSVSLNQSQLIVPKPDKPKSDEKIKIFKKIYTKRNKNTQSKH